METDKYRKIAVHELRVDGFSYHMAVIVVSNNSVIDFYPFTDEQPMTEWLGGTVQLVKDGEVYCIESYTE